MGMLRGILKIRNIKGFIWFSTKLEIVPGRLIWQWIMKYICGKSYWETACGSR